MILISLLIQHTHLNRMSLKKFIYLMIDDNQKTRTTLESWIKSMMRLFELLDYLLLIKYAKFIQLQESQ